MTASDIIGIALSMSVAVLAGCAFATALYFGGVALYETIRDGWRWLKAYREVRRREREEMLEEMARRMAR